MLIFLLTEASKDISLSNIGGHGDFAFMGVMGVAITVGAYVTTRKFAASAPRGATDPHFLSRTTMLGPPVFVWVVGVMASHSVRVSPDIR
jgi:hypothetical protein